MAWYIWLKFCVVHKWHLGLQKIQNEKILKRQWLYETCMYIDPNKMSIYVDPSLKSMVSQVHKYSIDHGL